METVAVGDPSRGCVEYGMKRGSLGCCEIVLILVEPLAGEVDANPTGNRAVPLGDRSAERSGMKAVIVPSVVTTARKAASRECVRTSTVDSVSCIQPVVSVNMERRRGRLPLRAIRRQRS